MGRRFGFFKYILAECILETKEVLSREQVSSNNTLMQMGMDSIMLTRAMGRPNTLVKTHLACNIKLQAYLILYDARPVVLIRNIFDVLRSFVDHLATSYSGIINGYSGLYFEDKKNVVIHLLAMPLVEFFATWQMYAASNRCLIVQYEDIVDDWGAPHGRYWNIPGSMHRQPKSQSPSNTSRGN